MNRNMLALAALGGGIAVGAAVRAFGDAALINAAHLLQPVGAIWLNALRMTLVPLVFAMVARGMIVLDGGGRGGRLLGIALPLLIGLLVLAMAAGIGFGVFYQAVWPVARGAFAASAQTGSAEIEVPSISEMIVGLVPANPIAAASAGNMAAVVVFAMIFGFAVSRTTKPGAASLSALLDELATVMIQIVHWVLRFAPLGIFVLSLGLALNAGLAVAGLVVQMIIGMICAALVAIVIAYLLAWLIGGVGPLHFGRAISGVQAMAAGTCSSAATLPAMLEASETKLGIPSAVGGAVLPLTVSIFRFGTITYGGMMLILLLHATGIPIDPNKLVVAGAILILTNLGVAGLPGAAVIYASWSGAMLFLGLPLELIPLLIAANALPDMIITVGNVTADMAVTTSVARLMGIRAEQPALPGRTTPV